VSESFELSDVNGFSAGAVGVPGDRTFYLQATSPGGAVWFKCEKQQVAALAEYFRRLMIDLPQPVVAPVAPFGAPETEDDAAFVLGTIGVGYETDRDRVVLVLDEIVPVGEDGEPDADAVANQGRARLHLTRDQVMAFIGAADDAVAGGRPTCRWCGLPMNVEGHHCPRMN
jgi:uncharacterized repeat protein (TIGR03847 family)